MKSIRTDQRNHAAEGDERIRTAVCEPGDESVYEALRWFARPEAWTITAWGLDGMRLEFNPPPGSPYSTPWGVARDALGGPYAVARAEARDA